MLSEKLVPGRNSYVNKLLYRAVDARVFLWVQVIDVARELHSPVFLESQVRRQPLILIRPVFHRNAIATYIIRPARIRDSALACRSSYLALSSPRFNGAGYADNFFLEEV